VVDGERPLKFSFQNSEFPAKKFDLYLYLTSQDILRAFHKNKFHHESNINWKKSPILLLYVSPTRRASGQSYEMEPPEGADTRPPKGGYSLFGGSFQFKINR
jgi:hypothetical protein